MFKKLVSQELGTGTVGCVASGVLTIGQLAALYAITFNRPIIIMKRQSAVRMYLEQGYKVR